MKIVLFETAIRIIGFCAGISFIVLLGFGLILDLAIWEFYKVIGGELTVINFTGFALVSLLLGFWLLIPITYFLSPAIVRRSIKTKTENPSSEFQKVVHDLSQNLRLPAVPKILFIDDVAHASVFGIRRKNMNLIVSKRLLEILSPDEIKSIILHELSHVANWDVIFMTWGTSFLRLMKYWILIFVIALVIYIFVNDMHLGNLFSALRIMSIFVITYGFAIPFLMLRSASRMREYTADANTCRFLDKNIFIEALSKLYRDLATHKSKNKMPDSLKIIPNLRNKTVQKIIGGMFSTHPNLKQRILAIENLLFLKEPYEPKIETAIAIGITSTYISVLLTTLSIVIFRDALDYGVIFAFSSWIFPHTVFCVMALWQIENRKIIAKFCLVSSSALIGPLMLFLFFFGFFSGPLFNYYTLFIPILLFVLLFGISFLLNIVLRFRFRDTFDIFDDTK